MKLTIGMKPTSDAGAIALMVTDPGVIVSGVETRGTLTLGRY